MPEHHHPPFCTAVRGSATEFTPRHRGLSVSICDAITDPLVKSQFPRPRPPPPPRGGAGASVPPSARVFMFSSAVVNVAVRCALLRSRAASSASIELSNISV